MAERNSNICNNVEMRRRKKAMKTFHVYFANLIGSARFSSMRKVFASKAHNRVNHIQFQAHSVCSSALACRMSRTYVLRMSGRIVNFARKLLCTIAVLIGMVGSRAIYACFPTVYLSLMRYYIAGMLPTASVTVYSCVYISRLRINSQNIYTCSADAAHYSDAALSIPK